MKLLKENWFKLFLAMTILIFLGIQLGNFEIERTKIMLSVCKEANEEETIQKCFKIFSNKEIFKRLFKWNIAN